MDKRLLRYCATDKEIYDVIMSSKQKISEAILLEIAKDRGIFYSPKDTRETLANNLALLPHDYYDLNTLLGQREGAHRAEKITSVKLNSKLEMDDIKSVAKEFKRDASGDETVVVRQEGPDRYVVSVKYSEIDYSKNRLVQRKQKEAEVEIFLKDDQTIIRMPASDKGRDIVADIKNRLDGKKKTDIPITLIELSDIQSADKRTEFFTSLITRLPEYDVDNVTSVKVESSRRHEEAGDVDLEDQDEEQAEQEMMAVVNNVAFKGQSLLASEEYQQLRQRGFYITSLVWRAKLTRPDYRIVEFEAAFDEPEQGKGFKYNIRGAQFLRGSEYTKTLRHIEPEERQELLTLLEQAAHQALNDVRNS